MAIRPPGTGRPQSLPGLAILTSGRGNGGKLPKSGRTTVPMIPMAGRLKGFVEVAPRQAQPSPQQLPCDQTVGLGTCNRGGLQLAGR